MMAATAPSSFKSSVLVILVFLISFLWGALDAQPLKVCKFDQIYQLGDSLSDTGNLIRESRIGAATAFARLPYGATFFRNATGRCSNGLLMIDYIARAADLPFLPPYKNASADFRHGVDFAVAGSTALPTKVLATKHLYPPDTRSSLDVQLGWMSTYFNSICSDHEECAKKLQSALFMVGEIGGNDINYGILQGKLMEELTGMIPEVVNAVISGAKKVISFGAKRLVVPGNFPIGCLPIYKTIFQTNIFTIYDKNQCVKQLNDLAKNQNDQLQQAIHKLKQDNPNVVIVYGDYYNAFLYLLQYAKSHGFDTERACCGTGGKYNFNRTQMCGALHVPVCKDPHRYMSWDGLHLTQEAYRVIAGWLVRDFISKRLCIV